MSDFNSVQGGDNPESPDTYHPLYITDNAEGGFGLKEQQERKIVSNNGLLIA